MSDSNVYEMLWDCQFCGTKGNLGLSHRFCPNCGAPQNPDSRYFPSDAEKVAVHNHEYVGVDVVCPACSELNSAAAEFCGQCGSALTEGARAKLLDPEWRDAQAQFQSSGSRDLAKEKLASQLQGTSASLNPTEKKKRSSGGIGIKQLIILGILAIIAIGAFSAFNAKKEVTVTVVDHEWERSVVIQEYDNFRESSWRDSRPSGDNVSLVAGSCQRQQRSTNRVADGQTCRTVRSDNGDGTFSERQECTTNYREEPVYDDMCTWTGSRWEQTGTEDTTGDFSIAPYWAGSSLACEGQQLVGCERAPLNLRQETYTVIYENQDDGTEYRCNYSQGEWATIPDGSTWTGQARALISGSLLCDSLVQTQ
ncbi:MAG: zinc ribbon domain-containing protein [Phototrophicaceae bacterium]